MGYNLQKTGEQVDAALAKAENNYGDLNTTSRTETPLSASDINGWNIDDTGDFVSDSDHKVRRYSVTAGNTYYVDNAHGRMIFESTAGTPMSGTLICNMVGDVVAPTGATLLTVSLPLNGTASVEYVEQAKSVKNKVRDMFDQFFLGKKPKNEVLTGTMAVGNGGKRCSRTGVNPIDDLEFERDGSYNGLYNAFFGVDAGLANNTGNGNTFVGSGAGKENTNGDQNTFLGWWAGQKNKSGYHNTYIGVGAAQNNISGYHNTFVGCDCNLSGTTGNSNTFVGTSCGSNNNGSGNVVVGVDSFRNNINGGENVAIGTYALNASITSKNTAVGYVALGAQNESGAEENVAVGYAAGYSIKGGSGNTFIGFQSGYGDNQDEDATNSTAIGNGTRTTKSNQVVIGNESVTEIVIAGKKLIFNQDGTVTWTAAT